MSTTNTGRRRFLAAFGAGGAAAAAAAITGRTDREQKSAANFEGRGNDRGYRLTEHVREYYRTARV